MGYYSDFHVDDTDIPNIQSVLEDLTEYGWYEYVGGLPYMNGKWYAWLEDLQEVANMYPDNYLIIIRYGEDQPDISRAVVRNGRVVEQKATLAWPED